MQPITGLNHQYHVIDSYCYTKTSSSLLYRMAERADSGLSVSQLMEDLADVSDWYGLGMALGLKSSQLDTIELEIPLAVGAVVRRKSRVLDTWKKGRADPPSWRDVVTALHQMKEDRTADRMRGKYSGTMAAAGGDQKLMVVNPAAVASTRARVRDLKQKWAKLSLTVCRKLSQENKVVVEEVLFYICALISIDLPDTCSTILKIFHTLQMNKLLDFWNCSLLWSIVNEYLPHDEELAHWIKEYQSELEHFKKSTKVINFIPVVDSELSPDVSDFDAPTIRREDHYQPYTFEMDADPREATLMDVERSWEAQINQYSLPDLRKGLLQLIVPSSILVTYLIPAKMVSAVVERVRACVGKFFAQQKILSITVGEERVYFGAKFPAKLRKKALVQDRPMSETGSLKAEVQRMSVQETPQASSQSPTGLSPCTRLQWRRGADAPEGIRGAQAVVMEERVYVNADYKMFQYDWWRDTWSTLPDCPVKRFGMVQFLGKLITVGGMDRHLFVTGKVYQFNGQRWKEFIPAMTTARWHLTVATRTSSSSKPPAIAACGGRDAHDQLVNTVEVYSHASSQWHTAKPLPITYSNMTSVIIDDTCYLLGGNDCIFSATKHCFSAVSLNSLIDNATSPHSQFDDPIWMSVSDTPLIYSTAASLRGSLIAIGGEDTSTCITSSAVHVLTSDGSWERVRGGDLPEPRFGSTAVCLPSGELLVVGGFEDSVVEAKRTIFIASIVD